MSKRRYTHLKTVEELIVSMRQNGMTLQEIADEFEEGIKVGFRLAQEINTCQG